MKRYTSVLSLQYVNNCCERDGADFAKRRRVDATPSARRSDKESGAVPPQPSGQMGVARPSAIVNVLEGQDTSVPLLAVRYKDSESGQW